MTRKFTSRPEYYERDTEKAAGIVVAPGLLTRPDGTTEPAITFFASSHILAVLPVPEAYRIASGIADLLTEYRSREK